ncbi:sugar ABC transporter substrate-binding protein, partial [Rhizobium ruizarguesonis]
VVEVGVVVDVARIADQTVISDDLDAGKEPEVKDTKTYDNGVKVVPSYLLKPVAVDKTNYKQIIVDSGYYSEDKLK